MLKLWLLNYVNGRSTGKVTRNISNEKNDSSKAVRDSGVASGDAASLYYQYY